MRKEILKIGFVMCLVMLVIFAVLLISNSILLSSAGISSYIDPSKYMSNVKIDTVLLFVFGIGIIIFKGLEINSKENNK